MLKKYRLSVFMFVMYSLMLGYSELVVLSNPIPNPAQLVKFRAQVLNADEKRPGIVIRRLDGKEERIYFAEDLHGIVAGASRFSALTDEQRQSLKGCWSDIYGKKVDWAFPSLFFVWQIDCPRIDISYEKIKSHYMIGVEFSRWGFPILALVLFGITVGAFFKERRGV